MITQVSNSYKSNWDTEILIDFPHHSQSHIADEWQEQVKDCTS